MSAINKNLDFTMNEFVCLPIIITDYSEPTPEERRSSNTDTTTQTITNTTQSTETQQHQHQQWTTGFTAFTDEMWSRMKGDVKQRLREACVEVLKRTDDAPAVSEAEKMAWRYDDDARFLD